MQTQSIQLHTNSHTNTQLGFKLAVVKILDSIKLVIVNPLRESILN